MQTDDWFKCYGKMWMKEIVPEAFCHPAKFSRALIRRIYAHATEEGWVKTGDKIVDPFGGVGLGGLEAMRRGLHWFGMELEANYCAWAQQNIDLWNERYSAQLPNWGTATILQGDSRQLASRLARAGLQAGLCLSSPPFANTLPGGPRGDNSIPGQMQRGENKTSGGAFGKSMALRCGDDPANLGNLPDVDFKVALAVSSPPYARDAEPHGDLRPGGKMTTTRSYGRTQGQLAQMPRGSATETDAKPAVTFWTASRRILEQVYQVLIPGGHAIFVCKRFVRGGEIVEFPTQWARLCEAVGFEWIHHHKAWQIDDRGAQYRLGGELEERQIIWQGFFRRGHAKKHPHLKIEWEDVLCFVKRSQQRPAL